MDKVEVRCGKCKASYTIDMTSVLTVIREEIGRASLRLQKRMAEALLESISSAETPKKEEERVYPRR